MNKTVRDSKKEYKRQLQLHPNLQTDQYQRQLQLHPNFSKKRYLRTIELHPNYIKEKYQRAIKLHPDQTRWLIHFKHKRIYLGYNILTGICTKCNRSIQSGKIKVTLLHHDLYDWNDILANTRELCTECHNKFHTGKPCPTCHRTLSNTRPKIPEINKPETKYEIKLWNQISWIKRYR